jgi:hypothetical protein
MSSIINSTTTSPGGLISTGDSDNSLLIQTGDTTAITISSTQQVALTNPLPVSSGGTGANSNAAAPFAVKGANSDITSLSGLTTALSIAQGGTGANTATAAFNALNPMTTTGDILYEASPTVAARLGIGSNGQVLTVASGIPSWATISTTPADGSITDPKIADGITAGTNWYPLFAGDWSDWSIMGSFHPENIGNQLTFTARVLRGGTYRFRVSAFNIESPANNSSIGFRIYQNGTALGSQTTVGVNARTTGTVVSSDVTLTTGARVEFYCQTTTANRKMIFTQLQCGVSNTLKILPISPASIAYGANSLPI